MTKRSRHLGIATHALFRSLILAAPLALAACRSQDQPHDPDASVDASGPTCESPNEEDLTPRFPFSNDDRGAFPPRPPCGDGGGTGDAAAPPPDAGAGSGGPPPGSSGGPDGGVDDLSPDGGGAADVPTTVPPPALNP